MQLSRKQIFYEYFQKQAPGYARYRRRFGYYWGDISRYCNYFIHPDDTVLEIGCGTGETLSRLRGKHRVGVDFSPEMIKQAKQNHPGLEFHVMEAEALELDANYDVVVLANAIGYFDNVLDVLESLKNVCHVRTRIFITYYNFLWEPALKFAEFLRIKRPSPRQNWLTQHDIQNLLYLEEFEAYHTTRRVLLPIRIPILSWILNKYLARLPLFNNLALNRFVLARPVFHQQPPQWRTRYSTSVIIPARNEAGNIEQAVKRMPWFGKHVEIIFVEGHSQDNTWEVIQQTQRHYAGQWAIKAARQEGKGKGDAVRKGFDMASGDILMILDADLTVPPEDLPKFYKAIATGKAEFINGSRLIYPMEKNAMRPLNTIGNKFFSRAFSWLLEQPIKDTLCGTKVMFRKDYQKLAKNRDFFGEFDPFGDYDLIFGAYKLNLKIIDLPVRYRDRTYGSTNISRFRHGFLLFRMVAFALGKVKFW